MITGGVNRRLYIYRFGFMRSRIILWLFVLYELSTTATLIPNPVTPIHVVSRAHDAPVYVSKTDITSTHLASGASDGTAKAWDIMRGFPTHVLRGHGGPARCDFSRRASTRASGCGTSPRAPNTRALGSKSNRRPCMLEGHVRVGRRASVDE